MDNDDKNYVFTFCIISLEKMTLWRFVTSKFSYCIIFYINIYGYAFGVLRSQIMKIILSRERDLKFILDLPIVQKWIRIFFLSEIVFFKKLIFLDKIVSNDYKNIFRLRGKKQFFESCFELFLFFCFLSTASHLCSVREIRLWGWPTKKLILSWSFLSPKLFKNFSRFKIQHVFA